MSLPPLRTDATSIVLRGHFNPAIFSPAWMLSEGLIGGAEYKAAEIGIVSRELASFSTDWLHLQASLDGFQISTTEQDESERLRDVAVGILSILRHTPVGVLGVNRNTHFSTDSPERWHEIGDSLAPKDQWAALLDLPGTKSLSIRGVRPDKYSGYVQITVEPSLQVENGIYVGCNDHFSLSVVDRQPTSRDDYEPLIEENAEPTIQKGTVAIQVLTNEWHSILKRSAEALAFVSNLGAR